MSFERGVLGARAGVVAALLASAAPGTVDRAAAQSAAPAGDAAGVQWTVPKAWTAQAERAMRVATYSVPAAKGDAQGGECAVFYFGPADGGTVEQNIERWSKQFEGGPKPTRATRKVGGLDVTTVDVAGTYLAAGGPMMQPQGARPNHRLLGAIVAAPQGPVFFKLTGPAATLAAARADFDALVASLAKK